MKEEAKKKEKERDRLDGIHNMRRLMQSTNNEANQKKTLLRDELLAQIEAKKSNVIKINNFRKGNCRKAYKRQEKAKA